MHNTEIVKPSKCDFEQEITGTKKLLGLWLWLSIIFATKAML